jgi:hypothetical protein
MATRGSGYNANVDAIPAVKIGVVGYTGFRGTAALPAIYWEEDPDTGVYSNAANNLSFAAGGVEYMRIKATPTLGSITSTAASGDMTGFQTKPNQNATTTGNVVGIDVSPRIQSGFGLGAMTAILAYPTLKGSGAGTITGDIAALELIACEDDLFSASATPKVLQGDVCVMKIRSNFTVNPSGDTTIMKIVNAEKANGGDWDSFIKFVSKTDGSTAAGSHDLLVAAGAGNGSLYGNIPVSVKGVGTKYIRVYDTS